MGWSMIDYGEYWAHAHDSDQILFMTFASEFLDSSSEFVGETWLQDWKIYWLEHKADHANGCCDLDLQSHLLDGRRIKVFRDFLAAYRSRISRYGDEIPAEVINLKTAVPFYLQQMGPSRTSDLLAFVTTIEDLLSGNTQNKLVHRKE
ncbi:hypothetical protein [Lysobacter brunescens]|uniref:Uncharacterized protein n=1 Tax=Lysobacter brunescens TaxID=262323 RepID=A0ABW2YAR3_9GAMM